MVKSKKICEVFFILFLLISTASIAQQATNKIVFSFVIKNNCTTSAAVYTANGTLVRNLWSGTKYKPGQYKKYWNGLLDDGKPAPLPLSKYSVKVLTNNVKYEWEGARIGNTSDALTGDSKHRFFEPTRGMTILGNTAYVAGGYNEAWPAQYKFNLATPQTKKWVGRLGKTDQASDFVVSDGIKVYWAGYDPLETSETFVFATNASNDALVDFGVNGKTAHMEWGGDYSAISYKLQSNSIPTGLAVQKTGNYLFVSRSGQNELQVLDKTSGALVRKLTIADAAELGIDVSGYLWIAHGAILEKFSINLNGDISSTGITISGLTRIGAFSFSPDGSTIAICDVNNQVVKGFSTSTGSILWTLGTPGGYITDATVTDNKFYFKDVRGEKLTYIAYAPDGSFWVGDPGNCRTQHYSANRTFIDRIMYMPNTYKTSVDKSNPKRLYADFMEFEIDYSKPLASSWKLKKNWAGNFVSDYILFSKIFNPITFPNGRVYSTVQVDAVNYPVIELVEGGVIRYTGLKLGQRAFLGSDGSIMQPTFTDSIRWNRFELTGYDASNNPIWSTTPEVLATVAYNPNDPMPENNMYEHPITASNKIMFFNPNRVDGAEGTDFHLGVVKRGTSGWLWKTAKGTSNSYSGPFPEDGYFDNGNGVEVSNRAGGAGLISGDNIFWGYHGEFWKQSQTNKWNHIDANTGLFVGQFGVLTKDFPSFECFAGGAGNVFEGTVVTVNDTTFLYHNDEGVNNGVHRWKITGLNTIEIQDAIILNEDAESEEGTDLMEGIDWGLTTLPNNFKGWTRFPTTEIYNDYASDWWQITTGVKAYDKLKKPDLYIRYSKGINNYYNVQRTFNNDKSLSFWKLSGSINWDGNIRTQAQLKAGSFLEVIDKAGKVISRLDLRQKIQGDELNVLGNDKVLSTPFPIAENLKDHNIEISANGGVLTFKFDDVTQTTSTLVEATADIRKPASMRLYFFTGYNGGGDTEGRVISISNFRFFNKLNSKSDDNFRTKSSGDWNDISNWESSPDGQQWISATVSPNYLATRIDIRNSHTISLNDSLLVDQLNINDGGKLAVLQNGALYVSDAEGDDIKISSKGALIINSKAEGTGRIGQSTGTISGNVTVERFISVKQNASYRMLAPSVNSNGSIKENWQQGVNNVSSLLNINPNPGYGTHITGSVSGENGFDASSSGQASLFTFNWQTNTPIWIPIANTNVNKLIAKTAYLLYVRGSRDIDLNKLSGKSNSTILSATGSVITGTVKYSSLLSNGRNSAISNPYPSPIDWAKLQAANSEQFENYYTMWDPNVGSKGGYVTVDVNGAKSVRTSDVTIDIQSGQAFIVKSKKEVVAPNFIITENDKSKVNNTNVFKTVNSFVPKLYTSLYFLNENNGNRTLADGVLSRFDDKYTNGIDENDAEDISNFDENLSLIRSNRELSIESMPLPKTDDTLFLNISNMKQQAYEWQFNASDFNANSSMHAFLLDSYLGTEIPVEMDGPTVTVFAVTSDPESHKANRFKIVFVQLKTLPVDILSVNASKQGSGINVEWKTTNELGIDHYIIERSSNGQIFTSLGNNNPIITTSSVNNYTWFDSNPLDGYNFYRIKSVDKDGSVRYTKTVRVLINKLECQLIIFPNPIIDNKFQVNFKNLDRGEYIIELTNVNGQTILSQLFKHSGGDFEQVFFVNHIVKGLYHVTLKSHTMSKTKNLIKL